MFKKLLLFAALAGSLIAFGYKYELEFLYREIFLPCPAYENNLFEQLLTLPENLTFLPDSSVYIEGNVTFVFDFEPTKMYKFELEFFKRERGTWQRTIYHVRRDDFCLSVFDPKGLWSIYTNFIPIEQRKCPFKKGQNLTFVGRTEQSFELTSAKLEGEYMLSAQVGDRKKLDEYFCTNLFFNLYRV